MVMQAQSCDTLRIFVRYVHYAVVCFAASIIATTLAVAASGADVFSIDSPEMLNIYPQEILVGVRELVHLDLHQIAARGYIEIPNEVTDRYLLWTFSKNFVPLDVVSANTIFPVKDYVSGLSGLKHEGIVAFVDNELRGALGGLFDTVVFVYSGPDNQVITIRQNDVSKLRPKPVFFREFINAEVSGHQAALVTKRSTNGATLSTISWYTERYFFEVAVAAKASSIENTSLCRKVASYVTER